MSRDAAIRRLERSAQNAEPGSAERQQWLCAKFAAGEDLTEVYQRGDVVECVDYWLDMNKEHGGPDTSKGEVALFDFLLPSDGWEANPPRWARGACSVECVGRWPHRSNFNRVRPSHMTQAEVKARGHGRQ